MNRGRAPLFFSFRSAVLAGIFLSSHGAGCGGSSAFVVSPAATGAGPSTSTQVETATNASSGPTTTTAVSTFFAKEPPLSLLADRLSIRMPVGARVLARPHSIMAADQPNEQETRAMLDAGDERFVVMTFETFERVSPGKEAEAGVRAAVKRDFEGTPTISSLPVADASLRAWAVVPDSMDHSREAILVLAVYTMGADGFVQTLSFYVNPPSAKGAGCAKQIGGANIKLDVGTGDLAGCTAFARAVASTLSAGPRTLNVGAGARKLQGQYNDDTFLADVPLGSNITTQKGPDFTVHSVRLPAELGSASAASLGVYIGGHPSYQYSQMDAAVKPTSKPGQVFGKAISWQVWPVDKTRNTRMMAEVIVAHPKSKNMKVHLFAGALDEKALGPLLDIATTLKLP